MNVELSIQISEDRNALLDGRRNVSSNGFVKSFVDYALIGFGHGTALLLCDAQSEVFGNG